MKGQGEFPQTPDQSTESELPQEVDKAIVWFVGSGDKRKFIQVCNENQILFRSPSSSQRQKCEYRVKYLKAMPHRLLHLFNNYFPRDPRIFQHGMSYAWIHAVEANLTGWL